MSLWREMIVTGEFLIHGFDVKVIACWADTQNQGMYGRTIVAYKDLWGQRFTWNALRKLVTEHEKIDLQTFADIAMEQLRNPECTFCGEPVGIPGDLCKDCASYGDFDKLELSQ